MEYECKNGKENNIENFKNKLPTKIWYFFNKYLILSLFFVFNYPLLIKCMYINKINKIITNKIIK